ncbi:methyltransferase domain-containing protein [Emticicia sp. BO119]|uniref:methyltransferase domain-containing protein n=1 Tax=Emticicia sp. BO119 TaxID=2757768 RepID=UPI0015F08EB4|nr:methyltransferase domain-containing protein [Emticicia sp. BO119]MBA4849257.1 methyltransferase domain-containing protein [Emticicia sp. BO119]
MNFKTRSYTPELLDNNDIPTEDLYQNLRELDFINRWLGGHKVVLDGVRAFLKKRTKDQRVSIMEIGSGGGDNLRETGILLNKKKIPYQLQGVDLKEDCVQFALSQQNIQVSYQICDYRLADTKKKKPHYIFNSLFCHHFTDPQLVRMLRWLYQNSEKGFFIADLHRHVLAYYSIKWLTRLFSKSYLVKNDAPLSVLRGFSRKEWEYLLQQAEIKNYSIQWKWAFRWLIIVEK